MSEKILFTDLDGTLLNSAKKVSPGMQLLLSKMVLAGNRLVLTSGRALPSVLKVAKNAGLLFPDTVIIAANGNEVYDCDTKTFLMRKSVPIEIAEDIISMAQEESLYLHSYSDTCVVAPKDGVEVKHYCSRTGMEYQVSDDLLKTIGHATLQASGDRYGKPRTSGSVSQQNSGKIRRQDLRNFFQSDLS